MTDIQHGVDYCEYFARKYNHDGTIRREYCTETGHQCLIDGPIPNRRLCTRREWLVLNNQRQQSRLDATESTETA